MSDWLRFVDGLDALVRLCAAEPEQGAKQELLARTSARAVRQGEVTLVAGPGWPTVNGTQLDGAAGAADGLVGRLWARGVQRLFVARDADPAELLSLARALAGARDDGALGAGSRLRTVRLAYRQDGEEAGAAAAAPDVEWNAPPLEHQTPFEPAPREPDAAGQVQVPAIETVLAHDDDQGAPGSVAPAAPMINTPILLHAIVAGDKRVLPLRDLIASMDGIGTLPDWQRLHELSMILEELGRRAERALEEGDGTLLRDIVAPVLRAAEEETNAEARLSLRMARRRLLVMPNLRAIAPLLPRQPERREELVHIFAQAGDAGADAIIEQLIDSESPSDRRVYMSTLVRLRSGERSLLHMLEDGRWYVVRNAADLLGEMRAVGAEEPLFGALRHEDERVRRSALGALGRLGTSRALHAVQECLGAGEAALRAHAATVLAASSWPYTTTALRRRLREETDPEVQLALVAALGRVATDDAVATLAELAEPPRLAFLVMRRATPLRCAALQALVSAHTSAARQVVQRMSNDRDAELRAAARRALDHWPEAGGD